MRLLVAIITGMFQYLLIKGWGEDNPAGWGEDFTTPHGSRHGPTHPQLLHHPEYVVLWPGY